MAMLLRPRASVFSQTLAVRGGGGHWHRPDPKPYGLYKYTRRYKLEDINSVLYSDVAPEFHMHLHSIWVQHSKQGIALITIYFCLIIMPMWLCARWLHKKAGSMMFPAVRPGTDHAHMAPALLNHLKEHNFEEMPDRFGRKPASFYMNWCRQDMRPEMKPDTVVALSKHGFNM